MAFAHQIGKICGFQLVAHCFLEMMQNRKIVSMEC